MRRLLPLLARTSPLMARKLFLPTVFTLNMMLFNNLPSPKCMEDPFSISQTLSDIDQNVIRIENNGNLVGEAFCFAENYLVSVRYLPSHSAITMPTTTQTPQDKTTSLLRTEKNFRAPSEWWDSSKISFFSNTLPMPQTYVFSNKEQNPTPINR
jgi:hypothetical protein